MKALPLKIGTRLSLGFATILLLIVILGGVAWRESNQIARRTIDIYEHPMAVRRALGELKADVLSMHMDMMELVLARDTAEMGPSLQAIAVRRADAQRQFDVLYDRYLGDREDVELASADFSRWDSVREETVSLLRAGRTDAATARTVDGGAGGSLVAVLMSRILKIDDFARNKADQLFGDSLALKASLDARLAVLVACIFVLASLIAWFLYRSIRLPLAELSSAARRFRAGEHGARSAWSSHDEFGTMSSSFNELAETIEAELALSSRAAALDAVMLSEDEARSFCRAVLASLIEHTGAQLGAVYLLDDEKGSFEHFESIGMDSAKHGPFSATRFEGELGAALAGGRILRTRDIPRDSRFTFSAASGSFSPREIVTMPLVVRGETMAIISLASIRDFDEGGLRLLDTVLTTLSARMDGVLAYRRLSTFSRRLEEQNRELEAQKNELSQQARELTQQNIELEMQKKQLDEANRLKTSFLSTMSHELRTPLNSVIALSGVLGRRLAGKIGSEEYGYIDVIERNGRQLLSLINDVLDLSRIEAGHEEVELADFDPAALMREVVDMIRPQAAQKGIALAYAGGAQPGIRSDIEKCRHVLQNIVANAVKFTEKGGVEVSAEARDGAFRITVKDSGIGIEAGDLELIFDEFRQADGSASRKYGGTGLGLAIARKYARLLGGDIEVESSPGAGSLFTIVLPLRQARAGDGAESLLSESRNARTPIGPGKPSEKTILLVEDSEAAIVQMQDILAPEGYRILVAKDGEEALGQVARRVPDAMILDLMMPGVDGFEVLKRIREKEASARLPVIILTAKYVTKDELAFLKHNHVQQLIRKGDIDREGLLEAVAKMLFPGPAPGAPRRAWPRASEGGALPLVLAVEDQGDNMLTLRALLAGKARLLEAVDGASALELAQAQRPDIVLMDIAMPGMNGIEALREMRKRNELRGIPVIAVSARAMKGDREGFLAMGFDGYISKPIDEADLALALADCLGQAAGDDEGRGPE